MSNGRPKSAFSDSGMNSVLENLMEEVRTLYLEDGIPWVVGYSGGKDSTATLQLVWLALEGLPEEKRKKPVHVISTDTLVENPVVAAWVNRSLEVMKASADEAKLPIVPHRLTPAVEDSFWVNLIGKGYPAPRPKFRWCTERLKIKPSNAFIRDVVKKSGEAILVLGIRKAESSARRATMEKHATGRMRDRLSPNGSLPNSLVYSPIEDWTDDDVWVYLMQQSNPWGYQNKDLLTMYQGATEDGECPLVVDSSTPSCGDSRFGCWTCTLVDQDKSMAAMIQNDDEKEWMLPLLEIRNALDMRDGEGRRNDFELRDFRRMDGRLHLFHSKSGDEEQRESLVHGPYKQSAREKWLRMVLEAQVRVRDTGPEEVSGIELVSNDELIEIRRIWIKEKHEFEDRLPSIYEEVTGEKFVGPDMDEHVPLGSAEVELLKEICEGDQLHFEMVRELLDIERQNRSKIRRAGLFDTLEKTISKSFFVDSDDAIAYALNKRGELEIEPREETSVIDDFINESEPKEVAEA